MTRDELFEMHKTMTTYALDLMKKKNADYAGTGSDPFANFRRAEALGVCSTEQAFLVRMTDKMSRLSTFAIKGKLVVSDEGVHDTLIDLINYSVLLAAYIADKQKNTQ
jgi:hypothetical protein